MKIFGLVKNAGLAIATLLALAGCNSQHYAFAPVAQFSSSASACNPEVSNCHPTPTPAPSPTAAPSATPVPTPTAVSSPTPAPSAAAGQGDTEYVLWPDDANGYSATWLKSDGYQVTGDTFYGSVGLINMQINSGEYLGYFGGDAGSDMKCVNQACSGYIAGQTASYSVSQNNGTTVIDGEINFYHFTATRTTDSIEIYSTGAGYLSLSKVKDGLWQGQAIYSTAGGALRTFRAQVTTSGSVLDDTGIFTFLLVAPLSVPDDHAAGL